ncbi:hypothetical protein BJ508DRAFT_304270 [Ascobolus immersus RN42]|uniref:Uncharacterized protein n=1 Tax=Ascobolus immersus RN42 TaxID=1160509 RepID=A0A3N4IF79_ASCIM|nr:hypothetical protein BJ508DRAFT_304270 [Ascobolus immersus RN42]
MNRNTRKRTRKALLNFSKREHDELAAALRDGRIRAVLREEMCREKVPQVEPGEEMGGKRRRSVRGPSTGEAQVGGEGQVEQAGGSVPGTDTQVQDADGLGGDETRVPQDGDFEQDGAHMDVDNDEASHGPTAQIQEDMGAQVVRTLVEEVSSLTPEQMRDFLLATLEENKRLKQDLEIKERELAVKQEHILQLQNYVAVASAGFNRS